MYAQISLNEKMNDKTILFVGNYVCLQQGDVAKVVVVSLSTISFSSILTMPMSCRSWMTLSNLWRGCGGSRAVSVSKSKVKPPLASLEEALKPNTLSKEKALVVFAAALLGVRWTMLLFVSQRAFYLCTATESS